MPTAAVKGIHALGRRGLILSVGALLLVAVIAGLAIWNLKPSPPQPVTRLVVTLPPGQQLAGLDSGPAVALSPDGTHLAYVARQGGTQQLYLRAMDSLEAKPIPGTEGAINPFFSPDGQWLGFFAGGKLKKVSVSGGATLTLVDAAQPSRGQLGQPGHHRFRTRNSLSSPASVGRGRRPAAADSSRERGDCPPLAGVLARRQGGALCCRNGCR